MIRSRSTSILSLTLVAFAFTACTTEPSEAPESGTVPVTDLIEEVTAVNEVYLPDYSYAGFRNGSPLPARAEGKRFDVTDYGAVADDGKDDSNAILEAIDAAHAHDGPVVVSLPAGRFILSDILYLERSDITLKGAGERTILYFPRPLKYLPEPESFKELSEYLIDQDKRQREPENNVDLAFSPYAWSGGFIWTRIPGSRVRAYLDAYDTPADSPARIVEGIAGATEVTVDTPERIETGDVLKIQWYNTEGADASLLTELYGDLDKLAKVGSHHWNYPNRGLVTQITRVRSVEGNRVSISDPLLLDAREAWGTRFVGWPHLENVGIADFTVEFPNGIELPHHVEDGFNAIYLTGLYDSYVSNVTIVNSDSGIITDDDANVTISGVTTRGDHLAHYSVHMGKVYNTLARGIRVENRVRHPLSFNTYSVKSVYTDCDVLAQPILDQHSGANHHNLFDNIRVHARLDDTTSTYPLFATGGAGYWKPSHGRYSTFYNIDVRVEGGKENEVILLEGPDDGPMARIIGVYGNREFEVSYGPDAFVTGINEKPAEASLYDWQSRRRR